MGNYFSINSQKHTKASNLQDNPTYFKSEVIDPSLLCANPQNVSTPVRHPTIRAFDPRSPTDDIDRTPIMFNEECLRVPDSPMFPTQHAEVMVDPRSPTAGITRTPVTLDELPPLQGNDELDGLIQVLNFTDLDNLSLSDIESPSEDELEVEQKQPEVPAVIPAPKEEIKTVSAPPSASNTPNKSKSSQRGSDENNGSLNVSKSSPSGLLARPRVPFGDVNRPVLASPRLQLQSKQKLNLRSEIIQQQQHHRI